MTAATAARKRRLAAWAARQDVALFDATVPIERLVAAGESPPSFYVDELHLHPRGNAVIAEALSAWLVELGMAPPPAPAAAPLPGAQG